MNVDRYSFKPMYVQLAEQLRSRIESGELKADSQLPTEAQLSEEYSISRNTVRLMLKKLNAEGLVYRIHGKGTFISSGSRQRKNLLVVLDHLPKHGSDTINGILTGVTLRAQQEQALVQVITPELFDETLERLHLQPEIQTSVIFLYSESDLSENIRKIQALNWPYLVQGSDNHCDCNSIDIDNRSAMKQVTEHLLELGYRRFGVFYVENDRNGHHRTRLESVISELDAHQITVEERYLIGIPNRDHRINAANSAEHFFADSVFPEAVICTSDTLAAELISCAHRHQIVVPKQMAVSGFDDLLFASYLEPALTTVRFDYVRFGIETADQVFRMMQDFINRRVNLSIRLELIKRGSTIPTNI